MRAWTATQQTARTCCRGICAERTARCALKVDAALKVAVGALPALLPFVTFAVAPVALVAVAMPGYQQKAPKKNHEIDYGNPA